MLADSTLVAFASTADLDRARAFYAETLGFELVELVEQADPARGRSDQTDRACGRSSRPDDACRR